MKTRMTIMAALLLLLAGCNRKDWVRMSNVTRIDIGRHSGTGTIHVATMTNQTEVAEFLLRFEFGGERDYTVKHRLPSEITLWCGTNEVTHASFEDRLLRWKSREWRLSRETASMLSEIMKRNGANTPSEGIRR